MRLALLTPPTDAPSRIPLTRGLPSASALQVQTGYLPRVLPLPQMDVQAAAAPMEALARFAATGGVVSGQMLAIVTQAEATKRNAQNLADSEIITSNASTAFDRKTKELEVSETHETFLPAADQAYREIHTAALDQAKNPDTRLRVERQLGEYRTTKYGQLTTINREKIFSFHTGVLFQETENYIKQATDQSLPPEQRALAEERLVKLHTNYAATGSVKPDVLVKNLKDSLQTITVQNAHGEMTKSPFAFYETGWEKYKTKMPLDDLTKLREQGRTLHYARETDLAQKKSADDKAWEKSEVVRMTTEMSSLEARSQGIAPSPGVPHRPVSDDELSEFVKRYQYAMTPEQLRYWTDKRAKLERDGPVNPTAFRQLRYDLYSGKADLGTIQQARLGRHLSTGETDDLMKIAIEIESNTTVPNYQAGKAQITERLGLTELNWLASVMPMLKPGEQLELRRIMADALAEYEKRVKAHPGGAVALGQEIGTRVAKEQFEPVLNRFVMPAAPPGVGGNQSGNQGGARSTPGQGVQGLWDAVKKKVRIGQ